MIRITVIAAGLAVAAMPAIRAADASPPPATGEQNSEHAKRGPHGPREQLQRLSEALSLTADQKTQIEAIYKANAPQRQAIMNDESLSREDRSAKMQELKQGTQAKIRALLTPEQQQKFDTMPRPGRGHRNGGPDNQPPPAENLPPAGNPPPGGTT